MITLIKFAPMLVMIIMLNVKNPVKAGVMILLLGAVMANLAYSSLGTIWVASMIFLLFMGGILVVFMIISSISPNEAPKKFKKVTLVTMLMLAFLISGSQSFSVSDTALIVKTSMFSSSFILALLALMSTYFFLFIMILSKRDFSLRSFM